MAILPKLTVSNKRGKVRMTQDWITARDSYEYNRGLREYAYLPEYPRRVSSRLETIRFEELFRTYGQHDLEAWFAVVHWKSPRSVGETINRIKELGISAGELWCLCHDYVQNSTRDNFSRFRCKLVKSTRVATAATFPAFMCPERFPMVDTRIAAWAQTNGTVHRLLSAPAGAEKAVFEGHWDFVKAWIDWCRRMAATLTNRTGDPWRARDVEMAVFTAQLKGLPLHPLS